MVNVLNATEVYVHFKTVNCMLSEFYLNKSKTQFLAHLQSPTRSVLYLTLHPFHPLSITTLQLYWPPCSILNTETLFLFQGFCTCCPGFQEHSSPQISPFSSFRSQLKCQPFREVFLELSLPRFTCIRH